LNNNKLDEDRVAILSTCLHNIEVLNIKACQLTTREIENISAAIGSLPQPVNTIKTIQP